jgi:hypothetical protein
VGGLKSTTEQGYDDLAWLDDYSMWAVIIAVAVTIAIRIILKEAIKKTLAKLDKFLRWA